MRKLKLPRVAEVQFFGNLKIRRGGVRLILHRDDVKIDKDHILVDRFIPYPNFPK